MDGEKTETYFEITTWTEPILKSSPLHRETSFRIIYPHHLGMNYYVNFLGRLGSNGFQLI